MKKAQKPWLKSYIDMKTELRKNAKTDFGNFFFMLMDKTVFEKTMKNVRIYRDINFVTIKTRRNYLVSQLNYYATIFFLKIY